MSYEGFEEYICAGGHYSSYDAHADQPLRCEICQQWLVWHHIVDQTNGMDKDVPSTFHGAKIALDPEEIECLDHRSNTYFQLRERWAPKIEGHEAGAGWVRRPTLEERRSWAEEEIALHERALIELKWVFRLKKNTLVIYPERAERSYEPYVYFFSGRPLWAGPCFPLDREGDEAFFALLDKISAETGIENLQSLRAPRKHEVLKRLVELREDLTKLG